MKANATSASAKKKRQYYYIARTDPKTLQAIFRAKSKRDTKRERKYVIRDDIKRSAEMLSPKPA